MACSIPESISKKIEKAVQHIFPVQNVFVRKVKTLKKPKFDAVKLLELHEETQETRTSEAIAKANQPAVATLVGSGGRL